MWREISNGLREAEQGEGRENRSTTWNFGAFSRHVFENTFVFRNGRNKSVFEDRAFPLLLVSKISKHSGVVQVSHKKLGFSFSLQEQMFTSVSLARSHGEKHK